jgi:hypothetical protein
MLGMSGRVAARVRCRSRGRVVGGHRAQRRYRHRDRQTHRRDRGRLDVSVQVTMHENEMMEEESWGRRYVPRD